MRGRLVFGDRRGAGGGGDITRGVENACAEPGSGWAEGRRGVGDSVCVTREPASTPSTSVPGVNSEENENFLGKLHGKKSVIRAYGIFTIDPLGQK